MRSQNRFSWHRASLLGGLALAGIIALGAGPTAAQGRSDEHGNGKSHEKHEKHEKSDKGDKGDKGGKHDRDHGSDRDQDRSKTVIQIERGAPFIDIERQTVTSYYGKLPPGQAKKGRIPPGFQAKQGAYLPAGYGDPLPDAVVLRLPARPGYERVVVGSDVLLMETATRMIVDVLSGGIR